MIQTKKLGRPKLPDNEKKTYQRVAVDPETYLMIKSLCDTNQISMIQMIYQLVLKEYTQTNKSKNARDLHR